MKSLPLDFAPNSLQRSLHTTPLLCWIALVAGLALCLSAGFAITRLFDQQRQLQHQQLRQQQAKRDAMPAAGKQLAIAPAQATAVNTAVLQLNLPWRDLHEAIEQGTPGDIALLSLDPDPATRSLRIVAEARNSDAMLAYVEKLKQQPFFVGAVLVKHEINEQDANHALRFQVDAQWTTRRQP